MRLFKTYFIISVITSCLTLLILACSRDENTDLGLKDKNKCIKQCFEQVIGRTIDKNESLFISLIDKNECFMCKHQFMEVASNMDNVKLPPSNKIFVFQSMRKIEQKLFLMEKLGIDLSDSALTVIFSDQVYFELMEEFNSNFTSCVVNLDSCLTVISKTDYSDIRIEN